MKSKTIKKLVGARKKTVTALIFLFFAVVALVFVMPTVLTFTNSLMSKSEIAANYGQIFSSVSGDAKVFVSTETNLKLIPDRVTFDQYFNVLIKNPQYLIKFWNSVILTVPIVLGQILIALLAAYGFARFKGKLRSIIFFTYVILMLMPYQVTLVPNYLVADWLDLLDTGLLERLREAVLRESPDIAAFGYQLFDANGVLLKNKNAPRAGVYEGKRLKKVKKALIYDKRQRSFNYGSVIYSLWSKAWRAELLREHEALLPDNLTKGEDMALTVSAVCAAKKICFLD